MTVVATDAALRRFGRAVAEARAARELSQEELADRSGVSQSNVSGWEVGRWAPEPEVVFAVERALKLPGGSLSQHLGYVPAKATTKPADVEAAILGSRLDEIDRRALIGLYRQLARRRRQP